MFFFLFFIFVHVNISVVSWVREPHSFQEVEEMNWFEHYTNVFELSNGKSELYFIKDEMKFPLENKCLLF